MLELLQSVQVLDPVAGGERLAPVLLRDGRLLAIDPESIPPEAIARPTPNAASPPYVLGPALVDLYSYCGEPGQEARDTLAHFAAAAAAGGFGAVALLPGTDPLAPPSQPPTALADEVAGLAWRNARYAAVPEPKPHLYQWAALTQGLGGELMAELGQLAAAGAIGWADGRPLSVGLVRRLLDYGGPLGRPLMLMARDRSLAGAGASVAEGPEALRLGLVGAPATAETAALAALIEAIASALNSNIAVATPWPGPPLHLMRLSTARGVELVRQAKAAGLPVTASVTWLHALCEINHISGRVPLPGSGQPARPYDPALRLEPPLGNPSDRAALVAGLRDGTIDAIAIDQVPYSYEEATVPFAESPPGAIGLELALPLLWSGLVDSGELGPLELWRALSVGPARCLGVALPERFALLDRGDRWTAESSSLRAIAHNSAWLGQEIPGRSRLL